MLYVPPKHWWYIALIRVLLWQTRVLLVMLLTGLCYYCGKNMGTLTCSVLPRATAVWSGAERGPWSRCSQASWRSSAVSWMAGFASVAYVLFCTTFRVNCSRFSYFPVNIQPASRVFGNVPSKYSYSQCSITISRRLFLAVLVRIHQLLLLIVCLPSYNIA